MPMLSDVPVCDECGKEVKASKKYLRHKNGTVLCKPCYDRLVKEGKIK